MVFIVELQPILVCLSLSKLNTGIIDSRGEGLETHAWDSVQFRPIRVSPTPTQCCSGITEARHLLEGQRSALASGILHRAMPVSTMLLVPSIVVTLT